MNRGWPPCDPLSARKTALRLFELQDDLPDVDLDDDCMEARLDIFPPEWAVEQSADNPDDWVKAFQNDIFGGTCFCRLCKTVTYRWDMNARSLQGSFLQMRRRRR